MSDIDVHQQRLLGLGDHHVRVGIRFDAVGGGVGVQRVPGCGEVERSGW